MSQIIEITDAQFESDVLNANKPVLVDFWAPWCGPCKMLGPILQQVADHYGDKIQIVKVNVDDNTQTPAKFGVRGVPTMMLFKDGENVETKVGVIQKSQLISLIDNHL